MKRQHIDHLVTGPRAATFFHRLLISLFEENNKGTLQTGTDILTTHQAHLIACDLRHGKPLTGIDKLSLTIHSGTGKTWTAMFIPSTNLAIYNRGTT